MSHHPEMSDELSDTQRARLFSLCFPEVSVQDSVFPVDGILALMGLARVIVIGASNEQTMPTAAGQRAALKLRSIDREPPK